MPSYRVTVRIGKPGRQYDVRDVQADTLQAALRQVIDEFPSDGEDSDLIEIRRQVEPEGRNYSAG